jgi:ATP-dependent helicase/nuclease subunit B
VSAPEQPIPTVLNIPPEYAFVDCLAKELLRRHGDELHKLGEITILTTTRRAARALQNAFLRETKGRPLLLPRMRPIGDVDEDELEFGSDPSIQNDQGAALELSPAIEPLRRQLLLSRLIDQRDPDNKDPAQAIGLAQELAKLLDQVQTEGLDFKGLQDLVPAEFAEHWQVTLQFLTIVSEVWPTLLEAEGVIDPAERRDLLLRRQIQEWVDRPPQGKLYAVGSTGSIPATAELLKLVANLPGGCVILPGLDKSLDEASWEVVLQEPSHPQYGLAVLLAKIGLTRDQVPNITLEGAQTCPVGRAELFAEAMRPAQTTELWRQASAPDPDCLDGISQINCTSPDMEAQVIALKMRETLNHPTRTAVLVTPDRDLSRRVSAELKRWDVEVDDSAGMSLNQSPPGVFLRLTAAMLAENFDPVATLAALKHPYAAMGLPRGQFRKMVRLFERQVLRGPRPAPGLDGLAAVVNLLRTRDDKEANAVQELKNWLAAFSQLAAPVATLAIQPEVDFLVYLKAHVRFAESLSVQEGQEDPQLWRGTFGDAAASFIAEALRAGDVSGHVSGASWPDLLDHLMRGRMVRAPYGQHPRLQIWGPIEGRLQRADLMILGGLNKGIWPPEAGNDPWMSRPMRQQFTLPLPEKKVGLSAHDFQQAFCASEVLLTRSEKVDGTPTVPSRWLLRLETLLRKFDLFLRSDAGGDLAAWQGLLDAPASVNPISAPRPTPPVSARPRQLSVTRIEKWIRNPYAIFADAILKLRPLDDIAQDPGAADKGTFIHKALEIFVDRYDRHLPDNAEEELLNIGKEVFGEVLQYPAVWAFWWPRFERIAHWFVNFERDRRDTYKPVALEAKGKLNVAAPNGVFVLTGTADRIDASGLGELSIVDYKTGSVPSEKQVKTGISPQLSLEAAMASHGAFPQLNQRDVLELLYVRLSGSDPAGETREAVKKMPVEELATEAFEGLQRLIAQFDKEATPYLTNPRPHIDNPFDDYAHLARIKEWSGGGDHD